MTTGIKSCEDALRLLAAHLDGELDGASEGEMDRHLGTCRSCYSRAEFERRLKDRVGTLGHETVRPELSRRIRTMIEKFTIAGAD